MSYQVNVGVLQADRKTPAPFAVLKIFKSAKVCVLWWCWDVDNYQYSLMTDLYGQAKLTLPAGRYKFQAEWKGKVGYLRGDVKSASAVTIFLPP